MLYKHRKKFEMFGNKIGFILKKIPISPNQWTLLTIIPLFISLFFLITESFLFAAIFFIITALFDLIDGSVARQSKKNTKLGAYLDTIMDRYVEGLIIISLFFVSLPNFILPHYAWIAIYLFGALMTTYAKSAAKEKIGKEITGGVLERAERLVILFFGILLATVDVLYLLYVIFILAILTNVSAIQRIVYAIRSE